ncbi:MAG: glycosyl transferase [Deltaproteobacteria bacterium]|nr:glycosyl transferase [Deltaproteobacteria bacterium]
MSIGVVVIGRNEGQRLRHCLESVQRLGIEVVYVDSGSVDGSCEVAGDLAVHVLRLDDRLPFSAARGRNEGLAFLLNHVPNLEFVQFLDGDCEIHSHWIGHAVRAMDDPKVAVVCGRRREKHPDASIYNLLCDMEWDTPIGDTIGCGGDSLVRVKAFLEVDGFDPSMVAGEEPDLCVRLLQQGWSTVRIDAEMTLHDVDMTSFSEWWKRMSRAGHAYAEGIKRHGLGSRPMYVRAVASAVLWFAILPAVTLFIFPPTAFTPLLLVGCWALVALRVYLSGVKSNFPFRARWIYSVSTVIGKVPELFGVLRYVGRWFLNRPMALIEYKRPPSA